MSPDINGTVSFEDKKVTYTITGELVDDLKERGIDAEEEIKSAIKSQIEKE